ncbi:ATP-binding protein [Nocardiopsis sp. FR6]|uniref:ATP-binding protein n=1 Tax=Nocardiopsis sp. FR6 TaxID=2605986 RepID=UPI00135C0A30|nr:ATP-binding protein [Nocardiopsis sp. FR6]
MSALVRWEHRLYPGRLSQLARVRADLARDLRGSDPDLVDTLTLVASELFANCVKYTDSGKPGGEVLRALSLPGPATLRAGLTDSGGGGGVPRIPHQRTTDEWDWAEGASAACSWWGTRPRWGHHRCAPWADLGTHVWAELSVDPAAVPPALRAHAFAG